jgi:nuclear pore complex protein Nup93
MITNSNVGTHPGQIVSISSTPQVSSGSMEIVPMTSRPTMEKKASVYAEVVKNLNRARQSGLPFKVCPLLSQCLKFKIRVLY